MGAVAMRRVVREPPDHGGWNIFYTYLGGFGNISPGPNIATAAPNKGLVRLADRPEMERCAINGLKPGPAAQQKIVRDMQVHFGKPELCAGLHV